MVAGGMAEWSMAVVLKTTKVQAFGGSNPSPSVDSYSGRRPALLLRPGPGGMSYTAVPVGARSRIAPSSGTTSLATSFAACHSDAQGGGRVLFDEEYRVPARVRAHARSRASAAAPRRGRPPAGGRRPAARVEGCGLRPTRISGVPGNGGRSFEEHSQ